MTRDSLDALEALLAVAQEGSFTRAAAKLGVSQSSLSQTVRAFEERIGLRLLDRNTRSVAATQAGMRLLESVAPRLAEIRKELSALGELRDTPSGHIRITSDEYAAEAILLPMLAKLLPDYPDIRVEVIVDYGLTDIVAERYDAGVRLGEIIANDMVSIPISADQRLLVVASPNYLAANGVPETPHGLLEHRCINLRLPTQGGLYVWEFEKKGREMNVRVEGQCTFNSLGTMVGAAISGLGFAYVPEAAAREHIERGALRAVLEDWSPSYPGYRLFYPSRRHHSAAFALIVKSLQFRH